MTLCASKKYAESQSVNTSLLNIVEYTHTLRSACTLSLSDQNNLTMPRYNNYDDYKLDNPYHDEPPERDYEAEMEEARYRRILDEEWEQQETTKTDNHDTNANHDQQDW